MEFGDIITAIVSLVSGGVISTLATLGLARKKQKAEISVVEANATAAANSAMQTTIKSFEVAAAAFDKSIVSLTKHLDDEQADNASYRTRIDDMQNQLVFLQNEAFCAGNLICLHTCCEGRKPPYGTGNQYIKDKLAHGEIETDQLHIKDIIKEIAN